MGTWWMWVVGVGFAILPFLLLLLFNRGDTADSRGRRKQAAWRR
jgi:hypothetical protein